MLKERERESLREAAKCQGYFEYLTDGNEWEKKRVSINSACELRASLMDKLYIWLVYDFFNYDNSISAAHFLLILFDPSLMTEWV